MLEGSLESIFETASDAIILADATGQILAWNPAAAQIFGYSADDAVGSDLTVIIPERFHADHHAGLQRVVQTGETKIIGHTVEIAGRRNDGMEVPIELSLASWVIGEDRYFSAIIRDVSERVAMVDALSAHEARLEAIVETANDAIVTIDASGLVTMWNPYAEEMFGRRAEEMVGQPLSIILPDQFRDRHDAGLLRLARGGESRILGETVELTALHSSGREFPIELSLAMWEQGDSRFFSGILRDITLRKEAEARSDWLLSMILPDHIAERLKAGESPIADRIPVVTILFADLVGSTPMADLMSPVELVTVLNELFSRFDDIADDHGLEKIKTGGDSYVAAAGLSASRDDHAAAVADAALTMRDELPRHVVDGFGALQMRFGIHTGPVVAGVIGKRKFSYDLYGDAVNVASRMESSGIPNQIQVSAQVYELISADYELESRGVLPIKGKGDLETYLLQGRRSR